MAFVTIINKINEGPLDFATLDKNGRDQLEQKVHAFFHIAFKNEIPQAFENGYRQEVVSEIKKISKFFVSCAEEEAQSGKSKDIQKDWMQTFAPNLSSIIDEANRQYQLALEKKSNAKFY